MIFQRVDSRELLTQLDVCLSIEKSQPLNEKQKL